MPTIISSGGQTRARNSYASSAQARLSLRVNGEESAVIITPQGTVVPAGFEAPTVAPVIAPITTGNVAIGFYVYAYVYASSRYPFVENAVTGGSELWPRSSPSPFSAVFQVATAAKEVGVTVTYSTRSDVDWIWVYRTSVQNTAALAQAQADAGQLFYIGRITNNTAGGTVQYSDNSATDTAEQLELDNFVCPLFRYTVFDGFYWWGWGNDTLVVPVFLDGSTTITINEDALPSTQFITWFSGRNSQTISFLGITTGGYDGRGNYYFQQVTTTTGQVFSNANMLTPIVLPATGTTTAYLSAPSTTLYRSKPLNPFSWGDTIQQISNNVPIPVPIEYAEPIGGGVGTAISLIPNERILKLDTQAPERSYALDLNAAGGSDFIGTLRTLDDAQSVSSHFSQFAMRLSDGQSTGTGVNAKALQLLSGDAQAQIPIGSPVIKTLRQVQRTNNAPAFFHGVYDRNAELNCWWINTLNALNSRDVVNRCDTLIYQHAPTGTWGLRYMPGVSASWTVFDYSTSKFYSFIGTEEGYVGVAFASDRNFDLAPLNTQIGTFFVNLSENVLSVAYTALLSHFIVGSDGFTAVVTTTTEHGLQTGDVIQIGPSFDTYSIFDVNDFGFSVRLWTFQEPGTDFTPINQATYVMPPIMRVPSVISIPGFGMYYISFPGAGGAGTPDVDQPVTYSDISYVLRSIYDYSVVNVLLPGDGGQDPYPVYIGGIPCYARRYYNASNPDTDKTTTEWWTTLRQAGTETDGGVLIGFYPEYADTTGDADYVAPQRDKQQDNSNSVRYFVKEDAPSDPQPCLGVETLEISYNPFQVLDMTLKQSES